ncbi:hypothetical protein [Altererythrobacter sp. ZODW24]|uniref:hypothetical protein n=1 Tax=Altererythrobacter sp. ZODW24 TaxID=2185142 RepID=UPI000DF84D11|nr:hypothetical protein [Altererythrobacter sp. ZODW24]
MTSTETPDAKTGPSMSGEERLKTRKRAFWKYAAIGTAAAFGAGIATGTVQGMIGESTIPAWTIFPAVGAVLAGLAWFSKAYLKTIDELDLADNLWASLIGLYFYLSALPVWTAIHEAGFVPEPDHWMIWGGTLVFTTAVYCARKLGLR